MVNCLGVSSDRGSGLKIKEADAAIFDATLIERAARPRTHVEYPPEDCAENKAPDEPETVMLNSDIDAQLDKKGHKGLLGGVKRGSWMKFIPSLPILAQSRGLKP